MRSTIVSIAASVGVAVLVWPLCSSAQDNRDFVFQDEDGHLVLRYAGAPFGGLSDDQIDEILDAEFSVMVHDRLRADLRFDAEPIDSRWAGVTEPGIGKHVSDMEFGLSAVTVECRSVSCRLVLEHGRVQISEHQGMLLQVQRALQSFIEAHPSSFEPVFLIAAYDQLAETPSSKAYLRRASDGWRQGSRPTTAESGQE
jgi:hypothetical protein